MPEPTPRLTLGDLANRVLATADPAARRPLVVQLGRGTRDAEQIVALADRFLTSGQLGRRVLLEWVAHVRGKIPRAVIRLIRPVLSDRKIPVPVRVAAAARLLRSLPDRPDAARRVARALTARLSPLRKLERLRQLQHQLERSRGLDDLIERREQRVKMDCPRCGVRLTRVAMVAHLWEAHGLLMEHGKVRSPQRTVEELKSQHAATRDTTVLDRTSLLAEPHALRAWVAASDPAAEDVAALCAAAEEHRAGLCPGCFAEVPAGVSPLPAPLALTGGRLAGDGYAVEVGGAEWFRTLTVTTPTGTLRSGPDGRHTLGPRGSATVAAGLLLLLALGLGVLAPHAVVISVALVLRLVLVAAVAYGLVWLLRRPLPKPADRAVDAAWTVLARAMVKDASTTRWLTRLCRSSVGVGSPTGRAGVLRQLTDRAATSDTEENLELLAAARVLQVEDEARHGRDRMAGLAALAAAGFRSDQSSEFAEYVAECVLSRNTDAGDLARFRTLLLAAAFESGLRPRDLFDLRAVAPSLRRAMAVEPAHRLALLHGVWAMRAARRWERVAPADSVFDLCRLAPNISGRVLHDFPDLLLYHRPDPGTEDHLGPVLVCARGVVVGGFMVADPDAEVEVVRAGRYGNSPELIFGPYRIRLTRPPPPDSADTIRGWLRFRAVTLLPLLDNYLVPGSPEVTGRVLAPFARRCPRCGTVSAVAVGKVGITIR